MTESGRALAPAAMKLVDALKIAAMAPSTAAEALRVALVCGFTPLHLQTFLCAELRLRYPDRHVEIVPGLYDDIPGTLRQVLTDRWDAIALILEWADIDPRLGLRRLGGWSPRHVDSILDRARAWLEHVRLLVENPAADSPIVLALPTLPLPPLFPPAAWQEGVDELRLRRSVWSFAETVARLRQARVVNEQALHQVSPMTARLNVTSTLQSGFPYRLGHAARLAELLATAIHNPLPKKGLITDLDNTLWRGIVGEDGPEHVSWDLDHHSQAHGLYQQFLGALAEEGVLVAVASKNDPGVVHAAFAREDMLLSGDRVFPFAVGWGSKADGVSHVLSAWNVSADSVIFVDDSPIELAEVKAAHPAIDCMQFPGEDPQAVYGLLVRLREQFGRSVVSAEDTIRRESLRNAGGAGAPSESSGYSEALLRDAGAELTIVFGTDVREARALELVNKTNQFNLNGRRFTERAWAEYLREPARFLLTASYRDRFGLLGRIAVLGGRVGDAAVTVDLWAMSCRAFARRIEHQCLKAVFERFTARTITFDYRETPRNAPLTRFLADLTGRVPTPATSLDEHTFLTSCPALCHRVTIKEELGDERYAGAAR